MTKTVIFAGNPNVGKSSVFNLLTGMNQHTGNWTGKTVEVAKGNYIYQEEKYLLYDLPGTYSLNYHSQEEKVAADFIKETHHDVVVVVCDATCLERNLNLVLQIIKMTPKVIVCVNLIDEAKKKKIFINFAKLSQLLQVPVIPTSARKNYGFDKLKEAIANYKEQEPINLHNQDLNEKAQKIATATINYANNEYDAKERKIDRILTHKVWGMLTMFALFMLIFWLTIKGSNYPSNLLFELFTNLETPFRSFLEFLSLPTIIVDLLVNGIYKVLTWVISVMLPPMTIFFPLFTILEDFGYLPRLAFCLDHCFKKCQSCGKQALTMCMGFGCNAVGVTAARIIDSKHDRLLAIITNSFVPCNGRFPTIIALISIFIIGLNNQNSFLSSFVLTLFIAFAVLVTLLVSKILSQTLLKGEPSSFTIELPPYRTPNFKDIIIRSIFDRTLRILYRAIICSIPAGIIIWLLLNTSIGNLPVITYLVHILNPLGNLLGLDGAILLAFILGFPANEIVMPIILMIYLSTTGLTELEELSTLKNVLAANNWTILTCLNFIIFSLFHYPCATTVLTIKKETNSFKWTILSVLIPLLTGISLCIITNAIYTFIN